ncbi:sigma 54-interacting transcriptional regulator [Isachenkonia alkalipeptolytica]|uniref:HTH-type transcriptional regulatory protein TyrR n=1 Tax=Isachenkonia alkalipeptolytica TaxID=2565777 RepID=A0AA44BEF0_9CLOT|nr:sigma 54-interacting transcriptional regulator [Isachenkonia alkalipeptolytica]NBG88080.1 PAS domain-containing protein [Isachenkonia alkalipeptolytica]
MEEKKLKLQSIKDTVEQIAEVIAMVLGIEVSIIDQRGERLYVTGSYKDTIEGYVSLDSVFSEVLEGKKDQAVTDKLQSMTCRDCSYRDQCLELANLCAPISVDGEILGLISLIAFDDDQRQRLVDNQEAYRKFIDKMANFLESKMIEEHSKHQISIQKVQLEAILNGVDEGIISVNAKGEILFINENAEKLLGKSEKGLQGKPLSEVFRHFERIEKALKDITSNNKKGGRLISKPLAAKNGKDARFFLGNYNPVRKEGTDIGGILSFRPYKDIYQMAQEVHREEAFVGFDSIVGESKILQETIKIGKAAAKQNSTVLIQGESGTGKEMFAKALHLASPRREKNYIPINCGSIPETLLESELFGYEPGAFTDANKKGKKGKFLLAHEGTIFLDEIGDMPLNLQVKLLRFLEDGVIEPLGSIKSKYVDVRVIAATNQNLEELMEQKLFREDLFYRLNVVPLRIPPLRERREDIEILAEVFLRRYEERFEKEGKHLSLEAKKVLKEYSWPGNVRELENCMEYALNVSKNRMIHKEDLQQRILGDNPKDPEGDGILSLDSMEEKMIKKALGHYKNTKAAAEALGIGQATIYRKMKKYGIT